MTGSCKAAAVSARPECARNAVRSPTRNSMPIVLRALIRTSLTDHRHPQAAIRANPAAKLPDLLSGSRPQGGFLPSHGRDQHFDPRRRGNYDNRCPSDEEPAFDGTDRHRKLLLYQAGIGQRFEAAIENEVAAIGDKRLLVDRVTPLGNTAELGEGDGGGLPAELSDLDRYWRVLTELLDEFFLIDDDDQPVAGCGDNLFVQQRAAQTFDQV